MKALTANAESQRISSYIAPLYLLEIDWLMDNSWAGKYADQAVTIGATSYLPYVQLWGSLQTSVDLRSLGSIDYIKVTMKEDDIDNFWNFCSQYKAENKPMRLGIWFNAAGATAADIIWGFYGSINAVEQVSSSGIRLDCIEFAANRSRELPDREVNLNDFVDAPQQSVGKRLPLIYGEIQEFSAVPVTAGVSTQLYGSHGPEDVTIRVYSIEGFPASGTLRIEDEEVTYTSVTENYIWGGTTVHAFLGCVRHVNSTEPALHRHGVDVRELVDETIFVIADHACKAISDVRVNGQIADTTKITVNTADTTVLPGSTLATIRFSGVPQYAEESTASAQAKVWPDAEGDGNINSEWMLAVDEIEANTAVTVSTSTSPLVLKRVGAIHASEIDASKLLGRIIGAWVGIEFSTNETISRPLITHDASVDSVNVNSNYGSYTGIYLGCGSSPTYARFKRAYIRLNASDIPASFTYVRIMLFVGYSTGMSSTTINVVAAAADWNESTITWNNQPNGTGALPTGAVIASQLLTTDTNYIEIPTSLDWTKGICIYLNDPVDNNTEIEIMSAETGWTASRPYVIFASDEMGSLEMKVIKDEVESEAFALWDPKYGHARPIWDTYDRDISRYVDDLANVPDSITYNIYRMEFTNYQHIGTSNVKSAATYAIIDSDWSTPNLFWQGSGYDCAYIDFWQEGGSPPAGATVKRVRFFYMAGRHTTGHVSFAFYVKGSLLFSDNDVYDFEQHYSDWFDLSSYDYDLAATVQDVTTKVRVTPHYVSSYLWAHMIGMEFEYEPAEVESVSTTAPDGTVTNYLDLLSTGIMDISIADIDPIDERIIPAHDAWVHHDYPTQNFGSTTSLSLESDFLFKGRAYLRCDPIQVPASSFDIIQLYLRVLSAPAGSVTIKCVSVTNAWGEATLTWNNQPNGTATLPTGTLLGSTDSVLADNWILIDLPGTTDLTKGVCIYFEQNDHATFYSSEYSVESLRPYFRVIKNAGSSLGDAWQWFKDANIAIYNGAFNGPFNVFNLFYQVEYLPITMVDSLDVTADVQGVESVGDGTGSLLENPADIIKDILINRLDFNESDLNLTEFNTAHSSLLSFGARFGFGLADKIDGWDLLADLAYQARCWLYSIGDKLILKYRAAMYGASLRSLTGTTLSGRLPGTNELIPFSTAEIINRLILKYDRDYMQTSDPFRQSIYIEDIDSQSVYGIREMIIEAWAIRDPNFADALAAYYLARNKNSRQIYQLKTLINNIDLECTDIVSISDDRWGLVNATGEIVQLTLEPGSVVSSRPHLMSFQILLDPYEYYWGSAAYGIIFVGTNLYVVIAGNVVMKISNDQIYIKGFILSGQSFNAAAASPLAWHAGSGRIQFALNDNTTVFEIDGNGILYVQLDVLDSQALSFSGNDNELISSDTILHINIEGERVLETDSNLWIKVASSIIEDAPAHRLL